MKKILIISLIIVGTLFQLLTVFRSGQSCDLGICFWGPNGHDGIWHLGLSRQVTRGLPPPNPVFSGTQLKNYHWGYNFLLGWLGELTPISIGRWHFQLLPLIFGISLGVFSFLLGKKLTGRFWVGLWFAFLNYFGNSLGWVITLFRSGQIGGESLFWSMQSSSFLLNPPFAMSVIMLLGGYFMWIMWVNNINWKKILFLGLIFGLLFNIKAYGAVLFFLASGITTLHYRKKNFFNNFFVLFTAGIFSLLVYLVWHQMGDFPFLFRPLWFIRGLFDATDRLYLPRLGHMWWTFSENWMVNPRFWLLASFGVVIFLIGNFNLRLFGLFKYKKNFWEFNWLVIILVSILIPLFFVQSGTAWNTIQFLYYGLIFSNFFLAKLMSVLVKNKKLILVFIILILTIGNIEVFRTYLTVNPAAYIPEYEVQALNFLSEQKQGIILGYPYHQNAKDKFSAPYPIYVYESTSYLPAYTGHQQYAADKMNLDITGYQWQDRVEEKWKFFTTDEKFWARGFLLNNRIDYIYLVGDQDFLISDQDLGINVIFDQEKVRIYQVNK